MAELHHFWFRTLGPSDWYASDSSVDSELRRRFAREWHALRHRPAAGFLDSPRGALAAVRMLRAGVGVGAAELAPNACGDSPELVGPLG